MKPIEKFLSEHGVKLSVEDGFLNQLLQYTNLSLETFNSIENSDQLLLENDQEFSFTYVVVRDAYFIKYNNSVYVMNQYDFFNLIEE